MSPPPRPHQPITTPYLKFTLFIHIIPFPYSKSSTLQIHLIPNLPFSKSSSFQIHHILNPPHSKFTVHIIREHEYWISFDLILYALVSLLPWSGQSLLKSAHAAMRSRWFFSIETKYDWSPSKLIFQGRKSYILSPSQFHDVLSTVDMFLRITSQSNLIFGNSWHNQICKFAKVDDRDFLRDRLNFNFCYKNKFKPLGRAERCKYSKQQKCYKKCSSQQSPFINDYDQLL